MTKAARLRVTLLSPFHGGSHAAWAAGLAQHSAHDLDIRGLPARFWRWRMEGAAHTLAADLDAAPVPDLLVATDMLDLATLLGLTRRRLATVPVVLYMHENQLTYPVQGRGDRNQDRHCGLINLNAMVAADLVVFNSAFHLEAWFEALPEFLARFPERHAVDVEALRTKCEVLGVGIETTDLSMTDGPRAPLVVWNQRWEHDKNPDDLMRVLCGVAERGVSFQLALCGEQAGGVPPALSRGIEMLGDRVVHQGHLARTEYTDLLGQARVVISTANHEFFGISVLEAACSGAHPLLPQRLSYPELFAEAAAECLYADLDDAIERLSGLLADPDPTRSVATSVAVSLRKRFGWSRLGPVYDRLFERVVASG